MFQHSVKVPRQYKIAANIYRKVSTEGGSVKTLLYDDQLRHFRTDVLYALITETIKHAADIDKVFEHCKLLDNEPRLDPWLAKVLAVELLFGKKSLPGNSKPEQTILSYKDQFEEYVSEHLDDLKIEDNPRPRYVRINTNLLTTSDAIRAFQDEGYRFIRCTSGSYQDYLEQIKNLTEEDFTQDYHVKTVFVFAPGTKWHKHELYLEHHIILQDKATTLAVHLLAPPPNSTVLDMCAAPGMKTTQLAAYMRNTGKIYAVERNEQRYQTLCDFVRKTGSERVQTFHRDSLDIKKGELDDVEYILLDPSCSGSGMSMSVHNYGPDVDRLEKLTSLQEKFLKHAMNSFPKAKRIVYSTCSLYPEENERVIVNVVKTSRAKWRVQHVEELLKGQWNNFGSAMYGSMGMRCLYAKPESDLTTGFFLAVLDRDKKDLAKVYREDEKLERAVRRDAEKTKKSKTNKVNEDVQEEAIEADVDTIIEKKKKDKQKRFYVQHDPDMQEDGIEEVSKKKKKHNKHIEDNDTTNEDATASRLETEHKKRRKRKDELLDQNSQSSITTIIDDLEDLNVNEQGMEPPKKKKKKDKSNSIETINDGNTEIVIQDDVTQKDNSKKKKNKIHETSYNGTVEDTWVQDLGCSESNLKKGKKKKKKDMEVDA